jgi:hypothetical protein
VTDSSLLLRAHIDDRLMDQAERSREPLKFASIRSPDGFLRLAACLSLRSFPNSLFEDPQFVDCFLASWNTLQRSSAHTN